MGIVSKCFDRKCFIVKAVRGTENNRGAKQYPNQLLGFKKGECFGASGFQVQSRNSILYTLL